MRNQLIKDLPIYINGFVVTNLFMETKCNWFDISMFILAIITFFWYGKTQRKLDIWLTNKNKK